MMMVMMTLAALQRRRHFAEADRAVAVLVEFGEHVVSLRQKLENDPKHPELIVTVQGIGYKFEGGKSVALLLDYSEVKFDNVTPDPGKTKIYALHTLFNF